MGYIVLAIAVMSIDILTKLVAELNFGRGDSLPLWENVFHLTYVENQGIAFGMFSGGRWIFIILSILVLIALAYMYTKTACRGKFLKVGTALIYGGALGNMIERLAKGYVIDFFDFRLIGFPVFNIADIAVCVGAVMLLIHFLFFEYKEKQTAGDVNDEKGNIDGK